MVPCGIIYNNYMQFLNLCSSQTVLVSIKQEYKSYKVTENYSSNKSL